VEAELVCTVRRNKKANRHFLEFCKHASKFLKMGIHTRKISSFYTVQCL
jgi:hypothetical protein